MLLGHQAQFDDLKARAKTGNLHHAQLFIGPESVGKAYTALLLAAHLQGGDENVVFKKQIFEGLHSDTLLFLDNGESLGIEEVRKIVSRSAEGHHSPYLIILIENLGRMKPEAVSVLLKTLEEPGEGTIFFLTAHQDDDILPTLRSRSHVTYFQTVNDEVIREACLDHVQTPNLVNFALGRPGKLRRLMGDPAYLEAHQKALSDLLQFLENPSTPLALRLVRQYESSPLLFEMLDILLQRTRIWVLTGSAPPILSHLDLTEVMDRIERSKQDLKNHVNAKLVLENLFLPFALHL